MRDWLREFDSRIVILVAALLVLGAVLVHGASAYTLGKADPDSLGVVLQHLKKVGLAVLVCLIASQVNYRRAAYYAQFGLCGAIVLLILVKTREFGLENAGIGRWVNILGVNFQPVEVAKLALVLALPMWIDREPARLHGGLRSMMPLILPPLVVGVLVLAQPNFGSALALGIIVLTILWVGGIATRWVVSGVSLAAGAAWIGFNHHPKLIERAAAWDRIFLQEKFDPGVGYQPFNAVMGLGNGGLFGVRAGEGITRYEFVPDIHTDFVFAIAGEQFGFVGVMLVLIAYCLLVARALKIARAARDGQAYLTAVAIATMIGVYVFLNLAMVSGLIPVMGLPLPFVSYGGTALLTNMAAIGVLLNIARTVRRVRRPDARWEGVR